MTDIPIIDVSPLHSARLVERREVADRLHVACRHTGFFYAAGHQVDASLIAAMLNASHTFFALPAEPKRILDLKKSPTSFGYGELRSEQLRPDRPPDVNESFNIGPELAPWTISGSGSTRLTHTGQRRRSSPAHY